MHLRTFINGVLVGILLGVLFAPDSGEETRRKLSKKAQNLKDSYDDLSDNVADTYQRVKDKAGDFVNQAKDKLNSVQNDDTNSMYNA